MMKREKHDLLILYSGGADSRLMIEFAKLAKKKPYCLLIDYSQKHKQELNFAKTQLIRLNIDFQIVEINNLNLNSALTGDEISGRFGDNISEFHVPGRNTMFAGIAFSVAENLGIDEIWLGADYSDIKNNFVDCKIDFINKMDELFKVNGSYEVKFRAPLLGLEKETILEMLNSFNVKNNEIFSGYEKDCEEIKYWIEEEEETINDNNYIELLYETYISLLSFKPPKNEKEIPITLGTFRIEGIDPLIYGYGIIYRFPYYATIDSNEIDKYKHYCKIKNLEETKERLKNEKE